MANEREQAMEAARDFYARWMADKDNDGCTWGTADVLADFAIEYATAEGIPQADGWVAIETVDDLPQGEAFDCDYLFKERLPGRGYWASLPPITPGGKAAFVEKYAAWMPIPPYQRQSSEGE